MVTIYGHRRHAESNSQASTQGCKQLIYTYDHRCRALCISIIHKCINEDKACLIRERWSYDTDLTQLVKWVRQSRKMCSSTDSLLSNTRPKLLTNDWNLTVFQPRWTDVNSIFCICCQLPSQMNCVSSELSFRRFDDSHSSRSPFYLSTLLMILRQLSCKVDFHLHNNGHPNGTVQQSGEHLLSNGERKKDPVHYHLGLRMWRQWLLIEIHWWFPPIWYNMGSRWSSIDVHNSSTAIIGFLGPVHRSSIILLQQLWKQPDS